MGSKLITQAQYVKLLANGQRQKMATLHGKERLDFEPVVKLFVPISRETWLLSELYPDDPEVAFGLCDLGCGWPEPGDVRLSELGILRGRLGLSVERDRSFCADKPLSAYANEAYAAGRIMA